jgi:16S rRNA (guanine966-N2)-methyltransferase
MVDVGLCLRHHAPMRANRVQNQLRIIGGRWRGRKLTFASLPGLRPTPDRVRETLFNWLSPDIHGSRCLDLYAGSGALGLEAASRGAARVVLVDAAREVVSSLREQVATLNASQVEIVQADAQQWLRGPAETFDIVFLDPPFAAGLLTTAMQLIEANGWLAPEAFVYIEAEKGASLELPPGWYIYREKTAGQVDYRLIKRILTP